MMYVESGQEISFPFLPLSSFAFFVFPSSLYPASITNLTMRSRTIMQITWAVAHLYSVSPGGLLLDLEVAASASYVPLPSLYLSFVRSSAFLMTW